MAPEAMAEIMEREIFNSRAFDRGIEGLAPVPASFTIARGCEDEIFSIRFLLFLDLPKRVPRYVFTRLTRCYAARRQERYWENNIGKRFDCQTVRTVCRLPRIRRFAEARNIHRYSFEDYLLRLSAEEQQTFRLVVAAMKVLLLRTLAPRRLQAWAA